MLRSITLQQLSIKQLLRLNHDELDILMALLESEDSEPMIQLGKWTHLLELFPGSKESVEAIFQALENAHRNGFDHAERLLSNIERIRESK